MRSWVVFVLLVLASGTLTRTASAEDAEVIYREGREALVAQDPERARRAFARGLDGGPEGEQRFRFLLGVALAHEMADAPARAAWFYRAFLRASEGEPAAEGAQWEERRKRVKKDLKALTRQLLPRTGELVVRTTPAGVQIAVDEEWLPRELSTPVTLRLPPGEHRVDLRDARGKLFTEQLIVTTAESVLLERSLSPSPEVVPAPSPRIGMESASPRAPSPREPDVASTPLPPSPPVEDASLVWWALGGSTVGLGGSAIATGAVLTALAQSDLRDLRDLSESPQTDETLGRDAELRARFARREGASIALFVSGAVLAGVGITTLVVAGAAGSPRRADLIVTPGGLGLRGRF